MNIALIYGGKSGEHEISLLSASAIARNIASEHKVSLIAIDKGGSWYLQGDSELKRIRSDVDAVFKIKQDESQKITLNPAGGVMNALLCNGTPIMCNMAICAVHGRNGEDGTLQGLLEMLDLPYTGCGVLSSSITMDKEYTKRLLQAVGISVVPFAVLTRHDISNSVLYDKIIEDAAGNMGYPLFVKPCSAGSSEGAMKANSLRELHFYLMEAFEWDDKVLIEKSIDAREIECAVMGNTVVDDGTIECCQVRSYVPGEIAPTHSFYDYDAKYNDPEGAKLWIPAHISDSMLSKIKTIAEKSYKALSMSGLARVDFFIDKNDGALYLNEINSIPGFTQISMFPKMCMAGGLTFSQIIDSLIAQGMQKYKARQNICTSRR